LTLVLSRISRLPPASVPPPRFASASFEGYVPANDSQLEACRLVREFAEGAVARRRSVWPWRKPKLGRGLYLDGGYGVGKTHLLAAAFHAAPGRPRAYLTFQELVHHIGAEGMTAARERYADVALLCLDEFELDDPGNTLIVKRFLEVLFACAGSVMTTSNTPPEAQGRGRFNAEDFRREIQGIAGRFRVVSVDGNDYRRRERHPRLLTSDRFERELARARLAQPLVTCSFDELLEVLGTLHPIRYGSLLAEIGTLFVAGVRPIASQNDALRFVHFIDQLYDRQVGLRASGEIALDELFAPSYRHGAYQRKHERCVSRLGELLEEPLANEAVEEAAD
jgi:cell division protein ZapE